MTNWLKWFAKFGSSFRKYQYHSNSLSQLDPDASVYYLVTTNVIATPIKVNMVISNFSPNKIWPPKHYWISYISMWVTTGCYFVFLFLFFGKENFCSKCISIFQIIFCLCALSIKIMYMLLLLFLMYYNFPS